MTCRRVLTNAQVREIRALHRPGVRGSGYAALAARYGLGASTVRDIVTYLVTPPALQPSIFTGQMREATWLAPLPSHANTI